MKDRIVKGKKEIKLFFKPVIVSIDVMDKFEQKSLKKLRSVKNIWYDWLICYIPESIRKSIDSFKDNFFCLFETNTHKQTVHGRGKK